MIRIELSLATRTGGDNGSPPETGFDPKYALHMPLGGFMRGALVQENFIREMISRGVLPTQAPVAPPAPAASETAKATGSPNFS